MSKKSNNGVAEITPEELEHARDLLEAVNLDEVTIEVIKVKIREYKLVDALDDDGEPILDDDGKPLKYRRATTRTAHIQNFVPLPIYNKMISLQQEMRSNGPEKQLPLMTELVLDVWKVSEPWMTIEKLNNGIDFSAIGALFKIFFNESRLPNSKA